MSPDPTDAGRRAGWMRLLARVTGEAACRAALREAAGRLHAARDALQSAERAHVAACHDRHDRLRRSYDTLPGQQAPHDIHALRASEEHLLARERQAWARCEAASGEVDQATAAHAEAQATLRAAIQQRLRRTEIAERLEAEARRAALATEEEAIADELMDRAGHGAGWGPG